MNDSLSMRSEDGVPVRSRVSWGALFAGAMIALALCFLLTLIGSAIGLSVRGHIRPSSVGAGAAGWAILTTVAALFVGGWVTSQVSASENKAEAAMHGIIVWGVLFAMLLWLMASGVRTSFNSMVGLANVSEAATPGISAEEWEGGARRAGVSRATIEKWRGPTSNPSETAGAAEEQPNGQSEAEAATRITWWAVVGTVLSMAAAVGGAVVGAGPRFRLLRLDPSLRHQGADRDHREAAHHAERGGPAEAKQDATSAPEPSDQEAKHAETNHQSSPH